MGDFSKEMPGRNVKSLTAAGSLGITLINGTSGTTTSTNYVTCGNGSSAGASVIYTLTGSTNGYNLTNITVYGGWADNGRDQQAYTVYYSTALAPTEFIRLASVNYNPAIGSGIQSATRVILTSSDGVLATNVAAVKFDFASPGSENGYCGYAGISVFGTASPAPAVPATLKATCLTPDSLLMSIDNLVIGRNNMLQSTSDLASGVWITETNFVAFQPAAVFTNSTKDAQRFYRVVGY